MTSLSLWIQLLGGIGLFLTGAEVIRMGFQESAGNSLRRLLSDHTETKLRGIAAGFVVSSAVQSASVVVLTLIGFVNSQILKLKSALPIVFGANLGKITTAWFIIFLGLKMDLSNFALPILFCGVLLRGFLPKQHKGYAFSIMGFSLLFLGISFLKGSIDYLPPDFVLKQFEGYGIFSHLVYLVIGLLLTIITQSSSAGLAITLSALMAGALDMVSGAALVIGLNFGTTSNAILGSIGAIPNAKRLVATHVAYNFCATLVGFLFLVLLFETSLLASVTLFLKQDTVIGLITFYSAFLLTASLVMLPAQRRLAIYLERHFDKKGTRAMPKFLNLQTLSRPDLATQTLQKEVIRYANHGLDMFLECLKWNIKKGWVYVVDLSGPLKDLNRLNQEIHNYVAASNKKIHTEAHRNQMYTFIRGMQNFSLVGEYSHKVNKYKTKLTEKLDEKLFDYIESWCQNISQAVAQIGPILRSGKTHELRLIHSELIELIKDRRQLHDLMNERIMSGKINTTQAAVLTDIIENIRRATRELVKGTFKAWDDPDVIVPKKEDVFDISDLDDEHSVKTQVIHIRPNQGAQDPK